MTLLPSPINWSTRSLQLSLLTVAFACATPAFAQPTEQERTHISRVCLWNGDRAVWKDLNLKRAQIVRLEQIRRDYPAVVDGQWITEEEQAVPQYTSGTGPNGARIQVVLQPATGLRSDLAEVLTKDQLIRWHNRCAFNRFD